MPTRKALNPFPRDQRELALVGAKAGLSIYDRCQSKVPRQSMYDGVFESFHGGLLMTIADSAACFAVLTLTPTDQILTTTDMNIRFLAPCLTDVHVKARVIKLGRLLCPVTVDLFDTAGTLVAIAQVTYMRLDRMPSR